MRLAFEAAIRRADPNILVRHQALLGQVKGDGLLTTTTWSGPRDGNSARA